MKKRLLFIGEASFLNTGFSNLYADLLPRLAATGKYEIGELGCYARRDDPRIQSFIQGRWKFWGNMPCTQEEAQAFNLPSQHPRDKGQNINQFGANIFEQVVAEFQADLCIVLRDNWMDTFILRSAFRPWFKVQWQPTVDAAPQAEEWIQDYEQCDIVTGYSDFGIHTLMQQSQLLPSGRRKMRIFPKPLRPGIDLELFKPIDKNEARDLFNINKQLPTIGVCMRNQSVLYNKNIQTQNGIKLVEEIKIGDKVLTAQGRLMPVINIWSYKEEKQYTSLKVFGNNIDGPSATSEHKFHFEHGKQSIGDAKIKDRIKMSVLPLSNLDKIDIAQYINIPEHWTLEHDKICYDWRGGHAEVDRYLDIDEDLMRLFGWYCAEGWISNHGKSIQFGINTHEEGLCNNIVNIIRRKFDYKVSINDDAEYDSRTLTWGSYIHALLFESLFKNGSRNKQIPLFLKQHKFSGFLACAYLEGDGSFYNPQGKNSYILASSFSPKLARDVRDILLSNGIFTTLGQSIDHEVMKTNLGIYQQWAQKVNKFTRHYKCENFVGVHKRWINNVDWIETNEQDYFLVPVVGVSHTIETGPFYDFEVEEDYTYNVNGYACDNSRKLYPDLIDAFARMKNKYKGVKEVDDAVLFIHSSWPDNMHSYDYPRHIYRLETMSWMPNYSKGIRGSILNTLYCHSCKQSSWTYAMNLWGKPIQEGRIKLPCVRCGEINASPPNTNIGFDRQQLAEFYNILDLYVQCSICEGEGMPANEAKACGVPVMAVDYSAMSEKVRFPSEYLHFKEQNLKESDYSMHLGGVPIDVERFYYEPETSCRRALPDIEDMANKMKDLICDKARLEQLGKDARLSAEQNYNGADIAKQWEYIFDNMKPIDRATTWDSPIESFEEVQTQQPPPGLTNEAFVDWLYLNVLKYPSVDTEGAKMWLQHLSMGVSRERLIQQFVLIGNQQSDASKIRSQIRRQVNGAQGKIERKQEFI